MLITLDIPKDIAPYVTVMSHKTADNSYAVSDMFIECLRSIHKPNAEVSNKLEELAIKPSVYSKVIDQVYNILLANQQTIADLQVEVNPHYIAIIGYVDADMTLIEQLNEQLTNKLENNLKINKISAWYVPNKPFNKATLQSVVELENGQAKQFDTMDNMTKWVFDEV